MLSTRNPGGSSLRIASDFRMTSNSSADGRIADRRRIGCHAEIAGNAEELPPGFLVDSIMQAPSKNIMNKLARSILSLYSYDDDPEHPSLEGEMRIALGLIAKMPILMDGAYPGKAA